MSLTLLRQRIPARNLPVILLIDEECDEWFGFTDQEMNRVFADQVQ